MPDPKDEVSALLKEHGAVFVRKAKHGDLYKIAGGLLNLPGSASDYRAWKNTLGDLRRLIRGSQTGVVEDSEDEDEMLTPEQIAGMGVHVQRSVRTVETSEVTMSLEAIAKLVGIWEEGAEITMPEVVDSGTLTLIVRTEKEEAA